MDGHYVINLGRQLGSGGKEIGEKLANDLGIAFYDKELINLASEESGLCKEFFEKADEKASQTILGGLFGTRFLQKEPIRTTPISATILCSKFRVMSSAIWQKSNRVFSWEDVLTTFCATIPDVPTSLCQPHRKPALSD